MLHSLRFGLVLMWQLGLDPDTMQQHCYVVL